jgi:hypothetical protein
VTSVLENTDLKDLGRTYSWELDELPALRRLISRPQGLMQRQINIIRRVFALFHEF